MSVLILKATLQPQNPTGDSDLAQLAASMSSGDWETFTTGNLSNATFFANGPTQQSMCIFTHGMCWDHDEKKAFMVNFSHNSGGSGTGGHIEWDDATNTWSKQTYDSSFNDGGAHIYQHLAVLPNGTRVWRMYGSADIRNYVGGGSTTWQNEWVTSGGYSMPWIGAGNGITGGLVWYPELNGGNGGLVFADVSGVVYSNAAVNSWNYINGKTSDQYDNNAVAANGYVYFGGGGPNGDLRFYRMDSTPTATQIGDLPRSVSQNADSANAVLLPTPDDSLLILPMAAGGTIYKYNTTNDTWATHGTTEFTEGQFHMPVFIPDYGVYFIPTHGSTQSTAYVQVYKP